MDVVFLKDLMHFSYESKHQGKNHKEIQIVNYDDFYISEAGEFHESGNHDMVNLDLRGVTLDPSDDERLKIEDVVSPSSEFDSFTTDIPNQLHAKEIPNLIFEPFKKWLSHHHTRGIPKPTYELELSSKTKFPMSLYIIMGLIIACHNLISHF